MKKNLLLQVNVPFCVRRCAHCPQAICKYDPHTAHSYAVALEKEIEIVAPDMADHTIKAISLEGGSPSLLEAADLQNILRSIRKHFNLAHNAQVSLQTMPGDYSRALMEKMRDSGVNFWIIGLNTADRQEHELLRRPYRYDALTMVDIALRTFDPRSLSFDLLYGIPGQSMNSWKHTLETALAYQPDHLSVLPLLMKKNSALYADCELRLIEPQNQVLMNEIAEYTSKKLSALGFCSYAPQEYCIPGKENLYKRLQLQGTEQLGIGYQALTIMDGISYTNGHSLQEYLAHPGDISVLVNNLKKLAHD